MQYSNRGGIWDSKDCALILIDYQPEMFRAVRSGDVRKIEFNVGALARAALAFNIPVVLSTVGVKSKVNQPTISSLKNILSDVEAIDRSTMNAWEDKNFLKAIMATGRRRLVFAALWTEICLAFPVIECIRDGYEASFVVDAVGGESKEEHDMAIARLIQVGAIPNTTIPLISEWFHDWNSPLANKGREILRALWRERSLDDEHRPLRPTDGARENRISH